MKSSSWFHPLIIFHHVLLTNLSVFWTAPALMLRWCCFLISLSVDTPSLLIQFNVHLHHIYSSCSLTEKQQQRDVTLQPVLTPSMQNKAKPNQVDLCLNLTKARPLTMLPTVTKRCCTWWGWSDHLLHSQHCATVTFFKLLFPFYNYFLPLFKDNTLMPKAFQSLKGHGTWCSWQGRQIHLINVKNLLCFFCLKPFLVWVIWLAVPDFDLFAVLFALT